MPKRRASALRSLSSASIRNACGCEPIVSSRTGRLNSFGFMASAAFRTSMLQSAAADSVRGRLQGVFIVVVAGGPRIADVVHGTSAAMVGTAAAAAGGGVLVVVGTVIAAVAVPSFVRYRLSRTTTIAR